MDYVATENLKKTIAATTAFLVVFFAALYLATPF